MFTINATAQPPDPQLDIDPTGSACSNDLEIRLFVWDVNALTEVGRTYWFPIGTSSSSHTYASLNGSSLWDVDPGNVTGSYTWFFL